MYGLYAAYYCAKRGETVLVLEKDSTAFRRATYINQARVHQGYHYPRSLSTAQKSANYFRRFNKDFQFCINGTFQKIYATSTNHSWTSNKEFKKFCQAANIVCQEMPPERFFNSGLCSGAFLTQEYTYDASLLCKYFLEKLSSFSNACIQYQAEVVAITKDNSSYQITTKSGQTYEASFLLNASYASTNQVLTMAQITDTFRIKYELCEIILTRANTQLLPYGITVMDGPFFSIMPFGKTGYHSLTAVAFTPHTTCYETLPQFKCQALTNGKCTPYSLYNCNDCEYRPHTAFSYMAALGHKYLLPQYSFSYEKSLFSMKPILQASEVDDSRPTVIKVHTKHPTFVSVLSGKINTVYDIEEVLNA